MSDNTAGRYGFEDVESQSSEYNAMLFVISRLLDTRCFVQLVRVVSVTPTDGTDTARVDVQPLVNQLDGQGVAVAHGVVHDLPYFRLQGGTNAVVLDPVKGDIGVAIMADRDISSVKATCDTANPGSMRRADMADGLYIGGFLNGAPSQFVRFAADGIAITSPSKITLTAPTIELDAAQAVTINTAQFTVNAAASNFSGSVTATGTITGNEVQTGNIKLSAHGHNKVQLGTAVSGGPVVIP